MSIEWPSYLKGTFKKKKGFVIKNMYLGESFEKFTKIRSVYHKL